MNISKSYRLDDIMPLDSELTAFLDDTFMSRQPNITTPNPKLLVVFSGGNGVGKSSLSRLIGSELHGLVLENDAIKRLLKRRFPNATSELSEMTWHYTMNLYRRLGDVTTNGLIVRDGVIDWYYDRILPIFAQAGYEFFIIAYDISLERSIDLIKSRGDTDTTNVARLSELLEEHAVHQKRFRSIYTPDITLTDDTMFDYGPVISLLRSRLKEIS